MGLENVSDRKADGGGCHGIFVCMVVILKPGGLTMDNYLWVKAFHVISIISWMAALLYMPRLFIYHGRQQEGSKACDTFKTMERKLQKFIMTPAMIASWLFGLMLAFFFVDHWSAPWFHVKLLMVVFLTGFHYVLTVWRKDFELDCNVRSERFYRFANEVPTVLMIIIVVMVIVKPF